MSKYLDLTRHPSISQLTSRPSSEYRQIHVQMAKQPIRNNVTGVWEFAVAAPQRNPYVVRWFLVRANALYSDSRRAWRETCDEINKNNYENKVKATWLMEWHSPFMEGLKPSLSVVPYVDVIPPPLLFVSYLAIHNRPTFLFILLSYPLYTNTAFAFLRYPVALVRSISRTQLTPLLRKHEKRGFS